VNAERPGLAQQLGQTRSAVGRLIKAHIELFKAEIGEIIGQLKLIVALGGVLVGLALFTANLLLIGLLLFLGEWLFGSLGWGLLHGVLLMSGLITAVILMILAVPLRTILAALGVAAVLGVVVAVVLALDLPRRAAEAGAGVLRGPFPALDPGWAIAAAAAMVGALVLGIIGLVLGLRSGGAGPAAGGLIGGLILGALLGLLLGGIDYSVHGAIATGLAVGLLTWPLAQAAMARAAGVDPAARFARLKPQQTIETVQETRAWLEAEWTRRRERLARR
jgi:hypothetical protein